MVTKEEFATATLGLRSLRKPLLLILGAVILCNIIAFLYTINSTVAVSAYVGPTAKHADMSRRERQLTQQLTSQLPQPPQTGPAFQTLERETQQPATAHSETNRAAESATTSPPQQLTLPQTVTSLQQAQQFDPPASFTLSDATNLPPSMTATPPMHAMDSLQPPQSISPSATSSLPNVTHMPQLSTPLHTSHAARSTPLLPRHHSAMSNSMRHTDLNAHRHDLMVSRIRQHYPSKPMPDPAVAANQTDWPIWWFAPFFDHSSFGMEAANLILGMIRSGVMPEDNIWGSALQPGSCMYPRDRAMPHDDFKQLNAANHRWNMSVSAIVICHNLPPFWARPKNKWQTCRPCPPVGYTPAVTIGRAMAETDIFHHEFVKYCNRMDEVWVPTDFSRDVLIRSGVPAEKLRVVPIPVNSTFYDPDRVTAMHLPIGQLISGVERRTETLTEYRARAWAHVLAAHIKNKRPLNKMGPSIHFEVQIPGLNDQPTADSTPQKAVARSAAVVQNQTMGEQLRALQQDQATGPKPFVFFSCFRWAMRKGWDILLSAYLQEFTSEDNVELYILTKPYVGIHTFQGDIREWAEKTLGITDWAKAPTLYIISQHITTEQYAGLLKASDAFVIATRGEGWGMPISEAMSMGLPVVVTNWSGVTAFVDETVGYMVDYNMSKVPDEAFWWFRGASWAAPSVTNLRQRLRDVMTHPEQAAEKGRLARQRMIEKFSPELIASKLVQEFDRLKSLLRSGHCGDKCHNKTWVAAPGDIRPEYYTGREYFIRNLPKIKQRPASNAVKVRPSVVDHTDEKHDMPKP